MTRPVIIHGPPASGKSRHAKALARHYGLPLIVDGWEPGRRTLQPNTLYLTQQPVAGGIHIADALKAAGIVEAPEAERAAMEIMSTAPLSQVNARIELARLQEILPMVGRHLAVLDVPAESAEAIQRLATNLQGDVVTAREAALIDASRRTGA